MTTPESQKELDEYYAQDDIMIISTDIPLCPRGFINITAIAPALNIINPNLPICDCPNNWNCDSAMIVARQLPLACPIRSTS